MSGSQGRGAVCQVSEGLQGGCRVCRRGWPEQGGGGGDVEGTVSGPWEAQIRGGQSQELGEDPRVSGLSSWAGGGECRRKRDPSLAQSKVSQGQLRPGAWAREQGIRVGTGSRLVCEDTFTLLSVCCEDTLP